MWWAVVAGAGAVPPAPPAGIDHGPFSDLLQRYVREDGLVDYGAWRSRTEDVAALDQYVAGLASGEGPRAEGREAVVGWVHAHNALVVREILRHPEWRSVREDREFFTARRHVVGGGKVSLAMLVEEGVVPRAGWRARGVLMVPARSGPPPPRWAPGAEAWGEWVEEGWRRWLERGEAFEWTAGRLRVPQPLFWHRHEWEAEGGWRQALAPWVPEAGRDLVSRTEIPVEFMPFDWTLNDPQVPAGAYGGWRMVWDRLRWPGCGP